jgi:hypothetical protein
MIGRSSSRYRKRYDLPAITVESLPKRTTLPGGSACLASGESKKSLSAS